MGAYRRSLAFLGVYSVQCEKLGYIPLLFGMTTKQPARIASQAARKKKERKRKGLYQKSYCFMNGKKENLFSSCTYLYELRTSTWEGFFLKSHNYLPCSFIQLISKEFSSLFLATALITPFLRGQENPESENDTNKTTYLPVHLALPRFTEISFWIKHKDGRTDRQTDRQNFFFFFFKNWSLIPNSKVLHSRLASHELARRAAALSLLSSSLHSFHFKAFFTRSSSSSSSSCKGLIGFVRAELSCLLCQWC